MQRYSDKVTLENPTPSLLSILDEARVKRVDRRHDMTQVDRELGTITFTTVTISPAWIDAASEDKDVLFVMPCEVGLHGVGAVKREVQPGGKVVTNIDTVYEVKESTPKLSHKEQHAIVQEFPR